MDPENRAYAHDGGNRVCGPRDRFSAKNPGRCPSEMSLIAHMQCVLRDARVRKFHCLPYTRYIHIRRTATLDDGQVRPVPPNRWGTRRASKKTKG